MKIVFLPDTATIFSLLQLRAMFEFHARYQILVMHNLLEQNAPMRAALPVDDIIALFYILHAWRTVTPTAIVSGCVSFRQVPLSAVETDIGNGGVQLIWIVSL